MEVPNGRNEQLDGLRTVAFLFVVLNNSFVVPMLWCGVDLFFVLSGFLITGILIKDTNARTLFGVFYFRRFLRIFPAYYLVLAVVFVFFADNWQNYWQWYVFYISNFQQAFGYEGWGSLGPTWSLAIEEQFYLLWPLTIFFLGRKRLWWLCFFLILMAPLFRWWTSYAFETFRGAYMLLPSRIDLLAMGAILALLLDGRRESFARISDKGPLIFLVGALCFGVLAAVLPEFRTSANSPVFNIFGYSLVLVMMMGIIVYFIPIRNCVFGKILRFPPIVYLGTISYMMYLSHQIVLHQIGALELGRIPTSIISLLVVIFFSVCSWHLFEKPIQTLRSLMPTLKDDKER
jgi:peptidoglycan/LPS O-acetylase OafA/YrhL